MIFKITTTDTTDDLTASLQQQAYLDFVRAEAENLPLSTLKGFLSGKTPDEDVNVDDVFRIMAGMADCALADDQFGIDSIVQFLTTNKIFRQIDQAAPEQAKIKSIVFIMFSWLSMLYSSTSLDTNLDHLQIDERQAVDLDTTTQEIEETKNPMWEVMQQFGQLLPVANQPVSQLAPHRCSDAAFAADALYVSLLNAATLEDIGHVSIIWVNSVGSHLSFNPETQKLMVFRLPSYTFLNRFENALFSK